MPKHGITCGCRGCYTKYVEAQGMVWDEGRRRYVKKQRRGARGGTMRSTAFRDTSQRNDPSVTNTYFNAGNQDGASHGHVKHRTNPDGTTEYLYVRDVEDDEYDA